MRTVRLVALSEDGRSLVLALDDADGTEVERFELPVDDRLRAAARGDARRLGQMDVGLGAVLSPRVIQSRIRAGQTPEQVAADSGAPVERIMRFAHPVLQERSRVAEQAREARVRLSEGTLTVNLHQFMAERVRMIGTDPHAVEYDAHRTDDGTWLVTGAWRSGEESGTACWAFDVPGRTVTPSDAATMDFAEGTRLVRVVPDVPIGMSATPVHRASRPVSMLRDDSFSTGPVVGADHAEGPDTAGHLTDDLSHLPDVAADEHVRDVHPSDGRPGSDPAVDALLDQVAEHDTVVLAREDEVAGGASIEGEDPRARIPAWEDIVFGVRRNR
jgi:hypothetical protein